MVYDTCDKRLSVFTIMRLFVSDGKVRFVTAHTYKAYIEFLFTQQQKRARWVFNFFPNVHRCWFSNRWNTGLKSTLLQVPVSGSQDLTSDVLV